MVRPVIAPDASLNPPALFKTQANKRILPNPNPAVAAGLLALVETHPSNVAKMLNAPDESAGQLVDRIAGVMAVNSLSAEAVLARFFSGDLMSAHLAGRLGKSGKGNPATLAARIVAQWRPGAVDAKKRKSRGEQAAEAARAAIAAEDAAGAKRRKADADRKAPTSAPSAPASLASGPRTASAQGEPPPHAHARTASVSAAPTHVGSRAGLTDLRSPPAPARPGGGTDPAAASRSSYDVADPEADATADGGSWHLSGSQDDLLTANWRMRRVTKLDAVQTPLPSLESAPDGGDGVERRRFYMREPFFSLRTRHLGALRQRPRDFYQLTRQGAMYKVERGGCPLCCGDEIFLLTLEQRDGLGAKSGRSSDAKPPTRNLCVPGTTRALPRHRLRCDSWTECHCDGTTKRFDEEVDVGYVMDGVGPVDVAAHLRTGKAK
jgi:hypothetical protein